KNIENGLQLVIYLRETICKDGLWIETILNRESTSYNYKLKELLPQLPNEAVKSRDCDTKYTPLTKSL
ncbi:21594_t:CDS:1, partial [Dentiscutata erythropus]